MGIKNIHPESQAFFQKGFNPLEKVLPFGESSTLLINLFWSVFNCHEWTQVRQEINVFKALWVVEKKSMETLRNRRWILGSVINNYCLGLSFWQYDCNLLIYQRNINFDQNLIYRVGLGSKKFKRKPNRAAPSCDY